jgi:alkylated DNA repair dioxygenase AlkB
MLMIYNQQDYAEPETFKPERFLEGSEPKNPKNILAWGAGRHLCPGKQFAIYEIKAALALLTTNFYPLEIPPGELGEMDYFSPSAFAERQVRVRLQPLPQRELVVPDPVAKVLIRGKKCRVIGYGVGGKTMGWLIRECLNKREQQEWYRYTVDLSRDSREQKEISQAKLHKAFPLTYDHLIYTGGTSNCFKRPDRWYDWASRLWQDLCQAGHVIDFEPPSGITFSSLYAQLYGLEATMDVHKDQYIDWGISVSLGSSAVFEFGDHEIILNGGDVFVADFSQVDHSIKRIMDNAPGWWSEPESDLHPLTFGRARCSVQIRDYSRATNDTPISIEAFKAMVQQSEELMS